MGSEKKTLMDLSTELLHLIHSFVGTNDLSKDDLRRDAMMYTSRQLYDFFYPGRTAIRLFSHVISHRRMMVEHAFCIAPHLLRYLPMRRRVTDGHERIFPAVSLFEYAVWSHHVEMWQMMLSCLQSAYQKGYLVADEIREQLCEQFKALKTVGLCYTICGENVTGHPIQKTQSYLVPPRTRFFQNVPDDMNRLALFLKTSFQKPGEPVPVRRERETRGAAVLFGS